MELNSAEHYANPENRRIVGTGRRRAATSNLSNHVPIRFAPAVMAWVRLLAARDGVTVSSWIRSVVQREVERRLPIARTGVTTYELRRSINGPEPKAATTNQTGDVPELLELVAGGGS